MRLAFLLVSLLFSTYTLADAWDNLTEEEAIAMVNYLQANPYVYDYCDCCQSGDKEVQSFKVELIKITETQIVPCSWDEGKFSVSYKYQAIATLIYDDPETIGKVLPPPLHIDDEGDPVIYMNYTWGFNEESKMAKPLFESIDYHYVAQYGGRSCNPPFRFPKPKDLEPAGKFKAYEKWYKRVGA